MILFYKFLFIICFIKIQIFPILLVSYRIIEFACLFIIFLVKYLENECSNINGKIFNKNNKEDLFILIIDMILNKIT